MKFRELFSFSNSCLRWCISDTGTTGHELHYDYFGTCIMCMEPVTISCSSGECLYWPSLCSITNIPCSDTQSSCKSTLTEAPYSIPKPPWNSLFIPEFPRLGGVWRCPTPALLTPVIWRTKPGLVQPGNVVVCGNGTRCDVLYLLQFPAINFHVKVCSMSILVSCVLGDPACVYWSGWSLSHLHAASDILRCLIEDILRCLIEDI